MPRSASRARWLLPDYHTRYGYPLRIAVVAELWWRVEHLGHYRGGDGGLFGIVQRWGYRHRKAAERRGAELAQPPSHGERS